MRRPIVVGNWKMNTTAAEASALGSAAGTLASEFAGRVDVGVAPPDVWLERVVGAAAPSADGNELAVFGQNPSSARSGAHTGESSPVMLLEAGARGVLIGHSERRHLYGETDTQIAAKVALAQSLGLTVILCVGEQLADRDAGATWDVVEAQLAGGLQALDECAGLVVAYEPVWAIGTGRTASPEQAQEVHAEIRSWLAVRFPAGGNEVRIQYGGSVKPDNAEELMAMADIDGALVGGASLTASSFAAIVAAAARSVAD